MAKLDKIKPLEKSSSSEPVNQGMKYLECRAYQICSNDDPRLILTYLPSRSNLLPNAFLIGIVLKVDRFIEFTRGLKHA